MPSAKVHDYAWNMLSASDANGFVNRLDSWLRQTYRYRSEKEEIVRTPDFMLTDLESLGYSEGDCDDVATLACALSHSVGIPSRLTAIAAIYDNPERRLDHVFAEIQTESGWAVVDPTVTKGTVYQVYSVYHEPV